MWLLAIVVVALLVGAPSASAAPPSLEYQCSPGPSDCLGWYRSAVNLSWDWDLAKEMYDENNKVRSNKKS